MTITDKVQKIRETINTVFDDEFDREFYNDTLNEFIEACAEYYITVFDSDSIRFESKAAANDLKDYQVRVSAFDNKRRNLHNKIIRNLVHLEKFAKQYNLEPIYGKLTDEELANYKLIENDSQRRTEVAKACIEIVSRLI